jgi:pilus assembly protein Flp/PilA
MLNRICAFTEAYVKPAVDSFKKDIKGATAIEYGLIAGGISLVIVAAVFAFGGSLSTVFDKMKVTMSSAAGKVK